MNVKAVSFLVALAFAGSASAEQLLVSQGATKSVSSIAIDAMLGGTATALQVNAQIDPKYIDKVNFGGCGKGTPATHQVKCMVNAEGRITIIAFSGSNELLPKGVVSLGSVSVPASAGFKVTEFLASDRSAQPIAVEIVDGAQK
jgi:hypothetical protein